MTERENLIEPWKTRKRALHGKGSKIVFVMRMMKCLKTSGFILGGLVLGVGPFGMTSAEAQTARTFADKPISVRLCPANCIAVNGHGLKPGGATNVLETRGGWARVSGFLDRKKLVPSFGNKITEKPALWVPVSALKPLPSEAKPAKRKTVAKKKPIRRVNVVDQVARLRRPPTPTFRPDGSFETAAVVETPVVETPVVETLVVETPAAPEPSVEAPKPAPVVEAPKVEEPKVEVVESRPIQSTPRGTEKVAALTWEEVQAKIEAQKARIAAGGQAQEQAPAAPVAAAPVEDNAAKLAQQQRVAEAAARQREENARKVAAAREAEEKRLAEEQKLAEEERIKLADENARLARKAEAARQTEARKQAEAKRLEDQRKAELAAKEAKEAEARKAAEAAETKRKADAAETARKAEAARVAAAKAAAEKPAESGTVGYSPPKAEETVEVAKAETPAVVLPPVVSKTVRGADSETAAPVETAKEEVVAAVTPKKAPAPEPVFSSAKADPIDFGTRPKKITRALLDKRLSKLPGPKSKVRKNIVIAMRHTALGLLNSGECKGIAEGGPSTTKGMFYLACTDDPGYLRQFPIEEVSW